MTSDSDDVDLIDIDVEALTRRYDAERLKRLRDDGAKQFQPLNGDFAHFAKDPHADPAFTRAPVADAVDVVIVGGGLAGLLAGARLRERGLDSIRIIEKAADFGGTWYWNRYPGVACDVESYIYMPMLEELGHVPGEKYEKGAGILEHFRRIARHYRLYDGALFQTDVTTMAWVEADRRWSVSTSRGDRISARFVVACKGLYSSPKLPVIPGIETFGGHSFHTSRWDYNYTGGDADGQLVNLRDKAVGVIGTGSTGIQCVPHLAAWSRQLYVFQRTPSSIDVRNNRPTDPVWRRELAPGWQRRRIENFTLVTAGVPQSEDLVDDSWTDILRRPAAAVDMKTVTRAEIERAQLLKMEKVRRRIDSIVTDKATAEALKPYYHYLCKRPGFSDDYLQAFNLPNVALVDTAGKGVERVTPAGVVIAGREYALDCLIYATGFEFMGNYTREAGFDAIGRGGVALSQHWRDGVHSLFGMQTNGFPNLFLISLTQAGVSFNYTHIVDEQAKHIAYIVGRCVESGAAAVEATAEAVHAWVETIVANAAGNREFLDRCTPGYINREGVRDRAFELNATYAPGPVAYMALLEKWRADGTMDGVTME